MSPLCWGLLIVGVLLFAPLLVAAANIAGLESEQERERE